MSHDHTGMTLRPFAASELEYFSLSRSAEHDQWNFFGWHTAEQTRRAFGENGLLGDQHGTLAIDLDEQIVGDVGWHAAWYAPRITPPSFNIGIALLPDHRGRGLGSIAQRMLADYLFATYATNRVEAHTDVDNIAEQRALTKAGFTREGLVRGAQWRNGSWHDIVGYSRLRADV